VTILWGSKCERNTNAATIMIGEKAADLIKVTISPALKSPVA